MKYGFNKIYKAAINQDATKLKKLLKSYCIDEFQKSSPYFSACAKLAFENNRIATFFLLKHGANINYAAYGAAMSDNRIFTYELIRLGANVTFAAKGALAGNHVNFTEELLEKGAKAQFLAIEVDTLNNEQFANILIEKYGVDVNAIVFNAAKSNNQEYIEKLRKYNIKQKWIAAGYALGGHYKKARAMIKNHPNDIEIHLMVTEAARGRHIKFAENLCREHNIPRIKIAFGTARGGYYRIVKTILAQYISEARSHNLIDELLNDSHEGLVHLASYAMMPHTIKGIVGVATFNGHFDLAIRISNQYSKYRDICMDQIANNVLENNQISNDPQSQLLFLSHFNLKRLPNIIRSFKKITKNPKIKIKHTTRSMARKLAILKLKTDLNYFQAYIKISSEYRGTLFLLSIINLYTLEHIQKINQGYLLILPIEILAYLVKLILPFPLSREDINQLVSLEAQSRLSAQLDYYIQHKGYKKKKAENLLHKLQDSKNINNFKKLIYNQFQDTKKRKQHHSSKNNKYHYKSRFDKIIALWNDRISYEKKTDRPIKTKKLSTNFNP